MATFLPLHRINGYLPLEDYGLIGDGATAALVGRDGAISWLCVPRFDSPPLFCGILDATRGGAFTVAPEDLVESRHFYEPDSGVLVTEMRSRAGLVQVTDTFTFRSGADLAEGVPVGRCELLRVVRVLDGRVRLRIEVAPRGGAQADRVGGGLRLRCGSRPELELHLSSTATLDGLRTVREFTSGDYLAMVLRWRRGSYQHPIVPDALLHATLDA